MYNIEMNLLNNNMKCILVLLMSAVALTAASPKRPNVFPKPERPTVEKELFGQWLDDDGYVTDGPKIKNWVDSDRDRVDDRFQSGPGKPAGKKRPEVGKPKPRPEPRPSKPTKPTKPTAGNDSKGKPSKPERPTKPVRSELSDDVKGKLDSYKEEKDNLHKELKAVLKKLDKPTRKEVRDTVEAFHKDNKGRFDAHKELGKDIKEELSQNRPPRPKKPEITDAVKELHKAQAEIQKKMASNHKDLMTKLKEGRVTLGASDRKELFDGFKEGQKDLHEELKSIQKQIRESFQPTKDKKVDVAVRAERKPPPRPKPIDKTTDRRPTSR
jgi:hypothetical protein